jgi:hypothetical protein
MENWEKSLAELAEKVNSLAQSIQSTVGHPQPPKPQPQPPKPKEPDESELLANLIEFETRKQVEASGGNYESVLADVEKNTSTPEEEQQLSDQIVGQINQGNERIKEERRDNAFRKILGEK